METATRKPDVDRTISFRPRYNPLQAKARLRVWNDERVALLTQVPDNLGMSITNAAEDAWATVQFSTGLPLDHPSWTMVEHYPPASWRGPTFAVVTFRARDLFGTRRFSHPCWEAAQLRPDLAWLVETIGDES